MANDELDKQAARISENLGMEGYEVVKEAEIVALIAYLQRLGTDIKADKVAEK
jgi:cytochrome c oxidase cbb3-type subunit I/II